MNAESVLKEKIGQMLFIGYQESQVDAIINAIRKKRLGGVILFASNIESPKQLLELTERLRHEAKAAEIGSFFIGIDYEGGTIARLTVDKGFPATLSAAALGKLSNQEVKKHAEQMALTLKKAGINLNFAPSLDVNINPQNPIIGLRERSFSEDVKRVTECGKIFAQVHIEQGITPTFKHFPGHGSSMHDSHLGFVDVTHTFQASELLPYKTLLPIFGEQVFVMMSHVINLELDEAGYPASLSKKMVQDVLRGKMQFKGLVVSDDLQMKAIVDHYGFKDSLRLAINAGVDKLIFGNQLVIMPQDACQIVDVIYEEMMIGEIKSEKLHETFKRAKEAKSRVRL